MSQPLRNRLSVGVGGALGPPASDLVKRSQAAEAQGFDSIWWADHLMGWIPESIWTADIGEVAARTPNPNVYFDPIACISAAATVTKTVTLGTCVTDAIRRQPAMLANEFLTLHHISQGRTVLGIGAGEGENIVPYGMDYRRQVSKLEEALSAVQLLWRTDGPVDFSGDYVKLNGAVLGLQGYEGTYPEIWVGANGRRMCEITGRLGDGWLPLMMPVDEYRTRLEWIMDSRRASGRSEDPFTPGMFSFLVLGEDHDEVHHLMEHPFVRGLLLSLPGWCYERVGAEHPMGSAFHGLAEYIPSRVGRKEALDLIDRIPFEMAHEFVLHGNPDEVLEQLQPHVDAGLSHVVLQNIGFLGDLSTAPASFRLLAEIGEQTRKGGVPQPG